MTERILLVADNNQDYLATTCELLRREGFRVLQAANPEQARRILTQESVDLALLDLRLKDDDDTQDISGLNLAKEVALGVPKVIVSQFGSFDAAREALGMTVVDGLPAAVRFVSKEDGFEALLAAAHEGLALAPHLQRRLDKLTSQLGDYFAEARAEAQRANWIALFASLVGIGMILYAGWLALQAAAARGVATAVAGMIVEAIGFLAFKRADMALSRRDRHLLQLLALHKFEILLAASGTLNAADAQASKQTVIAKAAEYWLSMGVDER